MSWRGAGLKLADSETVPKKRGFCTKITVGLFVFFEHDRISYKNAQYDFQLKTTGDIDN